MPKKRGRRRGHGRGTITQTHSGSWRAMLDLGLDEHGKRNRKSKCFSDRVNAEKWLDEQVQVSGSAWAHKSLRNWFDEWIKTKSQTVQPVTHRWYKDIGKHFGKIESTPLGELDAATIRTWLTNLDTTGKRKVVILKVLRMCLNDAVEIDQLPKNPAKGVKFKLSVDSRDIQYWSLDEANHFLCIAKQSPLYCYFQLAIDSGMRTGELLGLTWRFVTPGCVRVEKTLTENEGPKPILKRPKTTQSVRNILISLQTCQAISDLRTTAQWIGPDDPVFPSEKGSWRRVNSVLNEFQKLTKLAGLRSIRLYDLRHTSATILLNQGVNIKVISERLGHTDIAITLRHYASAMPSQHQQIVDTWNRLWVSTVDNESI
jgi:integrase